jgi:hypothetical protein
MRHALPNQSGGSRWQKQLQPFDGELSRIRNAAGIEPQNAEGQRRIDGTLQSPVYASTAKADCPLGNKPRAYTGPKDRSKSSTSSAGPRQSQESGAAAPVAALAGTPRARRVLQWAFDVAFAANLKLGWFRLSKPLPCQPEDFVLNLCFQNPPHEITFLRPQMQQALVPLTGNGVRRLSEIEDNGTVFDDYCIA